MDYPQELLAKFRQHLLDQSVSSNTLKNYLSDLRVFLFFATSQYQPLTSDNISLINQPDVSTKYEEYLATINPPATVKRRISSLRKFIDFCHQQGILSAVTSPPPVSSPAPISVPIIPVEPPPPPPPPTVTEPVPPPMPPVVSPATSTDPTNYNLIKLMPEVSAYTSSKRSSVFPQYAIYITLLMTFIVSFFITYFILH